MTALTQPSGTADANKKPASTAVRCKVCGYITDAANIKDVCPACGVKAAMFEPFTEKFSDKRRKFLELHIHPIIVHFPQAFAGTLFTISLLMLLLPGNVRHVLAHAYAVLSVGLPLTVIASFASGMVDGRVRFKKLTAPFLRTKIIVGIIYIGVSAVNIAVVLGTPLTTTPAIATAAFIAFGLVVCTTILGNIGAAISYARMPG